MNCILFRSYQILKISSQNLVQSTFAKFVKMHIILDITKNGKKLMIRILGNFTENIIGLLKVAIFGYLTYMHTYS